MALVGAVALVVDDNVDARSGTGGGGGLWALRRFSWSPANAFDFVLYSLSLYIDGAGKNKDDGAVDARDGADVEDDDGAAVGGDGVLPP